MKKSAIFKSGFALVEIILTVSLISMISAVAISTYKDFSATKTVSTAVDEVANVMQIAKSKAVSQVKPNVASCNTGELVGYQVVTCPGGCTTTQRYQLQVVCGTTATQIGTDYLLPPGVSFNPTTQQTTLFRVLSGATDIPPPVSVVYAGKTRYVGVSKEGVVIASANVITTPTLTPTPTPASGAPTVTISASPSTVGNNGTSVITWSSTNATFCTSSGSWSGSRNTAGTFSTGALVGPSSYTYTLTCTGAGGNGSNSTTISTVSPPTVTLVAGSTSISSGTSTTLTWTVANVSSCTKMLDWSGTISANGSVSTGNLTTSKNYRLDCTGLDGSSVSSPTVHVSVGRTTVNFTPTEDAYVSETNNTTNAGGSSYLQSKSDGAGANRLKSYLKFDLSSLASTRKLVSANLFMKACDTTNAACVGTTVDHRIRGVALADTWAEATICWSSSPSPCTGSPSQQSVIATYGGATTPIVPGDPINIDLTSYYADKLGIVSSINMTTDTTTNGLLAVFSKDYTVVADRPKLTIVSEL